ncbi:MAG: COX15/CtaA family protein [Deltaproteobacteria bacterium]|nr:COX15/CtaA family protein [Deltaproteobacteria bacterium]
MRKLILSSVLLTCLLIMWGGVVRTTGSGLGCPDWPLCHGQIIPPFEKEVLIEYTHRLLASLIGILTIIICITVWCKKAWRAKLGKGCIAAFILLLVQALLGGVTVKSELHPYIVATHLGVAMIFLTIIFWMFLKSNDTPATRSPQKGYYSLAHGILILLFFQIVLGGLVAASNAGLVCPDFPLCGGRWVPVLQGLVALQFFHRVTAFVLLFALLVFSLGTWKRTLSKMILLLGFSQVLLGVANVLLGLPLWVRLSHLAVATALFLALLATLYELRPSHN